MGLIHLRLWMKHNYKKEIHLDDVELKALIIAKELEKRGVKLTFEDYLKIVEYIDKREKDKNKVNWGYCDKCKYYEGERCGAVGVVGFCEKKGRRVMLPYGCIDYEPEDKD